MSETNEKTNEKTNTKEIVMALIPAFIIGFLFLISWTDRDFVLKDEWYEAISIVDSARTMEDPNMKKEYLERGGKWLLELKEKYPFHAKLRMFVGYYYIQVGKFDKAIEELHSAIEQGQGGIVNQIEFQARDFLTNALANKTAILLQQKKYDEAIKVMENSLPYAPQHPSFLNQFASVYSQANQINKAIEYLEKIMKISPNYGKVREQLANIYFSMGNSFARQNNPNQAYPSYKRAIELVQTNPHYYNNLANVELQLNKIEDSINHFKKAVSLDPNNKTFKGNLKIAENKLNQPS